SIATTGNSTAATITRTTESNQVRGAASRSGEPGPRFVEADTTVEIQEQRISEVGARDKGHKASGTEMIQAGGFFGGGRPQMQRSVGGTRYDKLQFDANRTVLTVAKEQSHLHTPQLTYEADDEEVTKSIASTQQTHL
ncbi:unnamed protein product, partial [Protopolystoma xenopodis]